MDPALTSNPDSDKPQSKKGFNFKIVISALALLAIIGLALVIFQKQPAKQTSNSTNTASKSATQKSGCGKEEYVNQRQGYQVCFPDKWQKTEIGVSAMDVSFDPGGKAPGVLEVIISDKKVDIAVQDTTNNSSKFSYEATKVDNVSGTKIIYTRGSDDSLYNSYQIAEDSLVSNFGRTYTIRLNTNGATKATDEKIYQDFLNNWKFISNTANPPWSNSLSILVYAPWTDDKITNPVTVSGEAIAFEAVLNVRIKDADNHVLLNTTIQTKSGQEMSPFSNSLSYDKPTTKTGTVEVFTISPRDGSEQDTVTIPVTFP